MATVAPLRPILYSWPTAAGQLEACNISGKLSFDLVSDTHIERIQEVSSDIPLFDLSSRPSLLSSVYPRMATRLDGSHSLSLRIRLRGGIGGQTDAADRTLGQALGVDNAATTDKTIARAIQSVLPQGTYSSVSVQTIQNYDFGLGTKKNARRIEVSLSAGEGFVLFFKSIGYVFTGNPDFQGPALSLNSTTSAILGSTDPLDVAELRKAYRQGATLWFYLSTDLSTIEFAGHLSQSAGKKLFNFFRH